MWWVGASAWDPEQIKPEPLPDVVIEHGYTVVYSSPGASTASVDSPSPKPQVKRKRWPALYPSYPVVGTLTMKDGRRVSVEFIN